MPPPCSAPLYSPHPGGSPNPIFYYYPLSLQRRRCMARRGGEGPPCSPPTRPAAPRGAGMGGVGWEPAVGGGVRKPRGGLHRIASHRIAWHRIASRCTGGERGSARLPPPRPKRRGEEGGGGEGGGRRLPLPPSPRWHPPEPDAAPAGRAATGSPSGGAPPAVGGGPEGDKRQHPPNLPLSPRLLHPLFNFICQQEGVRPPSLIRKKGGWQRRWGPPPSFACSWPAPPASSPGRGAASEPRPPPGCGAPAPPPTPETLPSDAGTPPPSCSCR